jgi:hypothetical protein
MIAFVVSAGLTSLIGAAILYFDYGYWHDDETKTESQEIIVDKIESPGDMVRGFFNEASTKWQGIKEDGSTFLQSTESYSRDGEHVDE